MNIKENSDIAIIGLGCKFPGKVNSPDQFWKMLLDGVDATTDIPDTRWSKNSFYSEDKSVPGKTYTLHGGFLDSIDKFDPEFFGISPREACYMDPQQKIILEVSWAAMEDAGIIPSQLKGKDVGVYIGAFTLDYKILQFKAENSELIDTYSATGLMMTMLSNRISYIYDFRGPSMTVDTACSSSLVTLHLACQALANGECSMALVGGINIMTSPEYTISESKGGFLSPDGRSKAFDASANGYARGEGAGIVVIKPLTRALKDGDDIYAVIKGTGVNQDGHTKGITVPRGEAHEKLIRHVYERAGVVPSQICYFEAHGTGTPVGDPIEANSISNVLKYGRNKDDKCVVGSVKTNIGHLEAAAGVAGLIKSCLMLKYKKIPPHLHFNDPNPKIPFDKLCIRVPREIEPLIPNGEKAIISINSFGFGGTNAHAVIEEPPARKKKTPRLPGTSTRPEVIMLSAHSEKALAAFSNSIIELLSENPDITLHDLASNLSHYRTHHDCRLTMAVRTKEELIENINAYRNDEERKGMTWGKIDPAKSKHIVFVYTGMGPIWWAMGRQLFAAEPVFKSIITEIDSYIKEIAEWSLIDEMHADEKKSRLDQPQYAQPANFALQAGLTELWKSYGIIPDIVVGHSVGEVAAAYASGILDLKTAVKVSIERSRIQQKAVGLGTMLAVGLTEEEAEDIIQEYDDVISIAAINSTQSLTLSGDPHALKEVDKKLTTMGVFSRFLKVNVAYHSCQMDPYKNELLDALKDIKTNESVIPAYSTVTGDLCGTGAFTHNYWWYNVRQAVRFSEAVENIVESGYRLFIEVGPHPVLANSITESMTKKSVSGHILASLIRKEDEQRIFYGSLGKLHVLGYPVDMKKICTISDRFIKFCVYPWQRERYWVESRESLERRTGLNYHPVLGRKLKMPNPCWENDLGVDTYSFLVDHKIQGSTVFPGAGYIEMAHAFLKAYMPDENCSIDDVKFYKALFMQENKYPITQFLYNPLSTSFSIYSRFAGGEDKEWTLNSSGKVSKNWTSGKKEKISLVELQKRCTARMDKDECYAIFKSMGFEYGHYFQALDFLYKGEREVLCRISTTDSGFLNHETYQLHPVLLDACFQGMIAVLFDLDQVVNSKNQFLPTGLDSIRLYGMAAEKMWSHIIISESGPDYIKGNITLFDDEENVIALVNGFNVKETGGTSLFKPGKYDQYFYNFNWIKYEDLKTTELAADVDSGNDKINLADQGTWIIFKDDTGLSPEITQTLQEKGQQSISIIIGNKFSVHPDKITYEINPNEEKDFFTLIEQVIQKHTAPVKGILYLWNLNGEYPEEFDSSTILDFQSISSIALLYLAKAIEYYKLETRFWIITRGAQAVTGEITMNGLVQAPSWGIGRVLGYQEMPVKFGALIDLDPELRSNDCEIVINEIVRNDNEDQTAYRNGKRYVPRIMESNQRQTKLPVEFKPDKTYLVTGAFGGLGMILIKWMTERGAKHFILAGRTDIPHRYKTWRNVDNTSLLGKKIQFIRELENKGVTTYLACLDIADYDQLQNFIKKYDKEGWPPIAGVIHTAGIVKDKPIAEMDKDSFIDVLKPKIQGAWNLHTIFEDRNLDFFIMYSSVSSLINLTTGQSNYASANVFLDALSDYRRFKGLPSVSINWGPWSDVGMASADNLIRFFESKGVGSLSPDKGMNLLETLFNYPASQVVVLPAQWSLVNSAFPMMNAPAMLAYLGEKELKESVNENSDTLQSNHNLIEEMRALPEDDRFELLNKQLSVLMARVFRIDSSRMDVTKPLSQLGMDSMMATEIKGKIEVSYRIPVSMVELMEGISIEELSQKLFIRIMAKLGETSTPEDIEIKYPQVKHDASNAYEPFPVTDVQMAYLTGRDNSLVLGGIGTHIYMEIETKFDIPRLNRAINKTIARHEMLRTVFTPDGTQKVLPSIPEYKISIVDISKLNSTEQKEWIDKERSSLSHNVFDPLVWPIFGIHALRLSDSLSYLFIGFDMIVVDGTSWQMIGKEILENYENPSMEMTEINFTFRDYMVAYNKFKESETYKNDKAYWMDKLEGFPPSPVLPLKKDPAEIQKPHFSRLVKVFDKEDWEKVKKIAASHNISSSALMCTVYTLILAQWSNQYDLALNVTVFNRYPFNKDVDKLIGDFTSIVVTGFHLKPGTSFWEKARHIQQILLEAIEHKHYDGVEFIRELSRNNSLNNNLVTPCVFTSMLTNTGYGMEGWQKLGEIKMAQSQTPQVYLDNQLIELDGALTIIWDYVDELFDEQDINRMFNQYAGFLDQLIISSDIDTLVIPVEDRQFIEEYNNTKTTIPSETLHELFIKQVRKFPNRKAVIFKDKYITYEELDRKSDAMAGYLNAQGISGNENIVIISERCIETIINILGVLKAGAAYVPVDPDYPEERRKYITENSGSRLILTKESVSEETLAKYESYKPVSDKNTQNTAYIIYTSGSTGKPKGVVINHGAVVNTILDINCKFNITEEDKIIGLSSFCFDLSVYDVFGALSTGASLVLIPDLKDITHIIEVIKNEKITFWNSVPAIMEMLIDNIEENDDEDIAFWESGGDSDMVIEYGDTHALRNVLLSGDWIPIGLTGRIKENFPNAEITSLGGATEASIWSIYYPINHVSGEWKSIPYGFPLSNQSIYVLNEELGLCPINVQGELYIGGVGLADGYQNDDEKTNYSFIEHPHYGRLYRTGDYGIYRYQGYIEFLGRKDQQVKIRGHRIELGEIENCLLAYLEIKHAVVVDREDTRGVKYLCAYIVSDVDLDDSAIREYLSRRLPEYMIPLHYVSISKIPLSYNGKVDKKALPEPLTTDVAAKTYVMPRNSTEKRLTEICGKLLSLGEISIDENLFDYGWDSISMISFKVKVKNEFGVTIPFSVMMAHPTIKSISNYINSRDPEKKEIVTLLNQKHDMTIFAFPSALTFNSAYLSLADKLKNVSVYSFDFIEDEKIIDLYSCEILKIQNQGPYTLLGFCAGGSIAYEVAKNLIARGHKIESMILIDSYFSIENVIASMDNKTRDRFKTDIINILMERFPEKSGDKEEFTRSMNERMDKYLSRLLLFSSHDPVDTDLHYITSSGNNEYTAHLRLEAPRWSELTSGKFFNYQGAGKHDEMLFDKYIEKNAALIQRIIMANINKEDIVNIH